MTSVRRWKQSANACYRTLSSRRGHRFLEITDLRDPASGIAYTLDETQREVYLACDAGATPRQVWDALPPVQRKLVTIEWIERFLQELVRVRLVFEDHGHFVSLAVGANDDRTVHS